MELANEYGCEMLRLRVRFLEQILSLTRPDESETNDRAFVDAWTLAASS